MVSSLVPLMEPAAVTDSITHHHLVAMPYPGRGHINPMMNLCKLIASKRPDFLITFIVTEEWFGFLSSETKPANIQFGTIPNVIPSELDRGKDFLGFYEATLTKLEVHVEELLNQLESPPTVIIYDTYMLWVVGLGNRRNIPVASLWTMSATVFTMFYHYDLLVQNGHLPINLSGGDEHVNCIPGVPSTCVKDLPTPFYGRGQEVLSRSLVAISWVPKAQYFLFTSVYELEDHVIDTLRPCLPVYCIGPAIPYFIIGDNDPADYVKWLDNQPKGSVLYISQGSFLSVSNSQMEEIVAGVHDSGVRYFWVARTEASRFKESDGDNKGLVVPWCDQLRVLCHPSIGGFWSHCGWNSTKEGLFAGVPILTLPIMWDQVTNSKNIVEDWKFGWRVLEGQAGVETLVKREEIAALLQKFMDLENDEVKAMRKRAKELSEICKQATGENGSSEQDIDAFINDISRAK